MKRKGLFALLLVCGLLLAGCNKDPEAAPGIKPENRPADVEPTASYDWMAGESPVPVKRIGVFRYGLNGVVHAVGPKGVYFLKKDPTKEESYIYYVDNGSDTLIKLCGRADCPHNNSDCNAYLCSGSALSFYRGYLYAVACENGLNNDICELIRMEPDGSQHVMVLDLNAFAKEHGGDYASVALFNDGICMFDVYRWDKTSAGIDGTHYSPQFVENYYYKLDGSMDAPKAQKNGDVMYSCGNVFLSYHPLNVQHGGQYGSYLSWDPETDTETYLTDHPGQPGYFDEDEGFFFRDGAIWRKDYATQTEKIMVETGLKGKYVLFAFPDCIVIASREKEGTVDRNLYIYNWAFELVDQVKLNYVFSDRPEFMLIAETAERFILTDTARGFPRFYINKSELGTGNVEIHSFKNA